MNSIVNYSEAREEAERLSRNLRRSVEVAPVNCTCDYSKLCLLCAGSGLYYQLVFTFCGHLVGDGEEDECWANHCREQEIARADVDLGEALIALPLRSCRDVASEQAESEAA